MYEEYHKADDEFYAKILKESLKSNYQDSVLDVEENYPMGPTAGYLTETYDSEKKFNALDMVKEYPSCLQKIETVPVFGYVDRYLPYDNHEIEDLTTYCVTMRAKNTAEALLFPTV